MNMVCVVCDGAGTLRDGSVCPRCDKTRWRSTIEAAEVSRPKRQAWIRAPYVEVRAATVAPLTKARTSR